MSRLLIGTSGYVYRHWRGGVFYPEGLRPSDELAFYAGIFSTVELNNPFYRVPALRTLERWRDTTPESFVFAVKVSRVISHFRRLQGVAEPLGEFVALVSTLGRKLGPLLIQLPPGFHLDLQRLESFLPLLSREHRWVMEFRHPSWQVPAVYDALARRGVALCVPVGGRLEPALVTTAPFTYIRVHRGIAGENFMGPDGLRPWAARIRALTRAGKDVYVYFNNDLAGHAARDALLLSEMLGLTPRAS